MARVTGDTLDLNAEFYRRLQSYTDEVGVDLHIRSGHRTRVEQQYLYNGWIKRLPGFNPANPPGRSHHEFHGAADAKHKDGIRPGDRADRRRIAAKHGLSLPIPREPWHLQPAGWSRQRCAAGPFVTNTPVAVPRHAGLPNAAEARILQLQLFDLGFAKTAWTRDVWADGVWGDASVAAMKRLQEEYNRQTNPDITVDGKSGPQTASAINWFYAQPATVAAGPRVLRLVSPRMTGPDVVKWQEDMNRLAGVQPADRLLVDGSYGPATAARTHMIQGWLSVPADGIVGARSREALRAELEEQDLAASRPELVVDPSDPDDVIIIPREEWGSRYLSRYAPDSLPQAVWVTVHTQGAVDGQGQPVNDDDDKSAFIIDVLGDERYHVEDRGFVGGVGYHFLIGQRGFCAQGRNPRAVAAAATGANDRIHICVRGNGDGADFPDPAKTTIRKLLAQLVRQGHLAPDFQIGGHRDIQSAIEQGKSCPGSKVTDAIIQGLRP